VGGGEEITGVGVAVECDVVRGQVGEQRREPMGGLEEHCPVGRGSQVACSMSGVQCGRSTVLSRSGGSGSG
jgi:hypothetical protein